MIGLGLGAASSAGAQGAPRGGDGPQPIAPPPGFGTGPGGAFGPPPGFGFGPQPRLSTQIEQTDLRGDGCPRADAAEILQNGGGSPQVLTVRFAEHADRAFQITPADASVGEIRRTCIVSIRLRVIDGRGAVPLGPEFFARRNVSLEFRPQNAIVIFARPRAQGLLTVQALFQVDDTPTPVAMFELPVTRQVSSDGLPLTETAPVRVEVGRDGSVDVFSAFEIRADAGTGAAIRFDSLMAEIAVLQ
jgi:hypothetical protein